MPQTIPEIVAHRGASAELAEHTRGAYELALQQGADALECDIRVSRDGHLVCVHDRRVDRTSNGRGVVSALTLPTMSAWDFSSWRREWPASADELVSDVTKTERGVLTLPELLGMLRDHARDVRLFVETKHPVRYGGLVERELVGALRRYGMLNPPDRDRLPVTMMSFSSAAVRRFRQAAPCVPTVLLFDRFGRWRSGVLPPWADYAGPSVGLLRNDPEFVARAAENGHDTYCWTVHTQADAELCYHVGARFMATNAPGATRAQLAGVGKSGFDTVR